MEIWKDIKNYEGLYQVSNYGRVKSLKRKNHVILNGRKELGYIRVRLCIDKNNWEDIFVHRLVCKAFIDNPLNKRCVNHKDFNRSNNNIDNLEWCTHQENIQHAYVNGRMKFTDEIRKKCLLARERCVIDLENGIVYDSLTKACSSLNLHLNSEWYKIHRNQKNKRFEYV